MLLLGEEQNFHRDALLGNRNTQCVFQILDTSKRFPKSMSCSVICSVAPRVVYSQCCWHCWSWKVLSRGWVGPWGFSLLRGIPRNSDPNSRLLSCASLLCWLSFPWEEKRKTFLVLSHACIWDRDEKGGRVLLFQW